jgi:hypothetical protein
MKLEDDVKNGHMELGCKNFSLFVIRKSMDRLCSWVTIPPALIWL